MVRWEIEEEMDEVVEQQMNDRYCHHLIQFLEISLAFVHRKIRING